MSTRRRLSAFGLLLTGLFGTAYSVGEAIPGHEHSAPTSEVGEETDFDDGHGDDHDADDGDDHGEMETRPSGNGAGVRGLTSVVDGHSIEVVEAPSGAAGILRFAVAGPEGHVTDFETYHGATLHLILIRADLSVYRHVHPVMADDGVWTTPIELDVPGEYRMVIDVAPAGAEPMSLGIDLVVPGAASPDVAVPAPADDVATPGGLRILRDGLEFTVTPADGLEPYLGSPAHLVAFQQGSLLYRHLHASGDLAEGEVSFEGDLEPGTWRLFLQVSRLGEVITVPFTEIAS